MDKQFTVVTIERIRTTYTVTAKDEEEARAKMENREPSDGVTMNHEEYYDLESIEEVTEDA